MGPGARGPTPPLMDSSAAAAAVMDSVTSAQCPCGHMGPVRHKSTRGLAVPRASGQRPPPPRQGEGTGGPTSRPRRIPTNCALSLETSVPAGQTCDTLAWYTRSICMGRSEPGHKHPAGGSRGRALTTRGEVRRTTDLHREEEPKTLPPPSCLWDEPDPVLPVTAMHHHIRLENYF